MFFELIAHEISSGLIFVVYLAQIINNRRRLSDLINYYNLLYDCDINLPCKVAKAGRYWT